MEEPKEFAKMIEKLGIEFKSCTLFSYERNNCWIRTGPYKALMKCIRDSGKTISDIRAIDNKLAGMICFLNLHLQIDEF